jgi:UDP-2,3-diacylglucosamine hydrolase
MTLSTEPGLQHIHHDSWTCVDFISDLHLSEHSPKTFQSFKVYLEKTPAQALFILGDLLEVWIGDDCLDHEPFQFERTCVSLIQKTSQRLKIFFMPGNRDFLAGSSFLAQSGMSAIGDPCVLECQNKRLLLSHGDALCLSDHDYQKFRQEVRSMSWQSHFLSKPLSVRLEAAAVMRAQSQKRQAALKPTEQAELDAKASLSWLKTHHCNLLIHGHTHRPMRHQLDEHHAREVLSDWDGHAIPVRAEVLRLQNSQLSRLELTH